MNEFVESSEYLAEYFKRCMEHFSIAVEVEEDCIEIDGWLTVSFEDDKFYLGHLEHDAGVSYYPDGSGAPPSTELIDDCTMSTKEEVLQYLMTKWMDNYVEQFLISEYEKEVEDNRC